LTCKDGERKSAFIFARIYKNGWNSWGVHNISDYFDLSEIDEWKIALKTYLN